MVTSRLLIAALLKPGRTRQPRKVHLDYETAAKSFRDQITATRRAGGILNAAYVEHVPMDVVDILNLAYEQGLANSPLAVRFPGDNEGSHDLHTNRDAVEKNVSLFHWAGLLVADAKNMHGNQGLKEVFGAVNREDLRTVLQAAAICNMRAHGVMGIPSREVPYLPG